MNLGLSCDHNWPEMACRVLKFCEKTEEVFPKRFLCPNNTKISKKQPKRTPRHDVQFFWKVLDLIFTIETVRTRQIRFCRVTVLCSEEKRETKGFLSLVWV